jgi:hypothetical protein
MTATRWVAAGTICLLVGCTSVRDPKATAAREYVKEVTGQTDEDLKANSNSLVVTVGDVTTDGRVAKIRGKVENRYAEPVEGVRYVVEIYAVGESLRMLGTYQREVDTSLEPGEDKLVVIDAESMYLQPHNRFRVVATPVKVGGREIPPPPGWTQP